MLVLCYVLVASMFVLLILDKYFLERFSYLVYLQEFVVSEFVLEALFNCIENLDIHYPILLTFAIYETRTLVFNMSTRCPCGLAICHGI